MEISKIMKYIVLPIIINFPAPKYLIIDFIHGILKYFYIFNCVSSSIRSNFTHSQTHRHLATYKYYQQYVFQTLQKFQG